MRTITNTFLKRLEAQKEEAVIVKFDKLASTIDDQIHKHANLTRDDDSEYTYDAEDLNKDVSDSLWTAAIRVQDYYGKVIDATDVANIIEACAADMIESIRVKTGRVIGVYEPTVPGEAKERTTVEVEDND